MRLFSVLLFASILASTAVAQDLLGDDDDALAGFSLEEPGTASNDLDQLAWSHLSEPEDWPGVRPARPAADDTTAYAWEEVADRSYSHLKSFVARSRNYVRPLTSQPLTTRLDVPEAGTYRVWLCYQAEPGTGYPITLKLGDQQVVYYQDGLAGSTTGAAQAAERPIHFETEMQRIAMPRQPIFIWEYRDLELPAGRLRLSLQTNPGPILIDAVFLTRSKDFRPSKALPLESNTLGRTFVRWRVAEAAKPQAVQFDDSVTWHKQHGVFGMDRGLWYGSLGDASQYRAEDGEPLQTGEWSGWLDASGALINAGGYLTAKIEVKGADGVSRLEGQLAWQPHEATVLKTLNIPLVPGHARGIALIPVHRQKAPTPVEDPEQPEQTVWGMRTAAWLARFRNSIEVADEHRRAVEQLDLPPGQLARHLRLTTTARPAPEAMDATATALRTMGFSHLSGPSKAVLASHDMRQEAFTHHNDILFHTDTHCPSDPLAAANLAEHFTRTLQRYQQGGWDAGDIVLAKLGDEIGAIVSVHHLNACSDCRARFHAYLTTHYGGRDFFGDDLELLRVQSELAGPGRYDRRLYYASHRFIFDFTAEFYALVTEQMEALMPNVRTYCNFSPHPIIFGGTMNHSDWFNLTRQGGTTLAWGEDWASMSSWGFWMGWQIVSYYAALVEAAARGSDGHAGFYAVGGTARQQFACLNRGLQTVLVYSYGPEYSLADNSNAWSGRLSRYPGIAEGLHAAGFGDELLANGQREPARVGVLYNRDHDLWHPDHGKLLQAERASAMFALEHANVPTTIVIEDDLRAGDLPYDAVYLNGYNLGGAELAGLRSFVEKGGIVIASGGAARYDRYNTRSPQAAEFLGVQATLRALSEGGHAPNQLESHEPIDTLTFTDGRSWPVVGPSFQLEPQGDIEVQATFADGSPALVKRQLGAGAIYTWAVMPGIIYRAKSPRDRPDGEGWYNQYERADAQAIAAPILAGGERSLHYGHHLVELRRFDLEARTAVTMTNYHYVPLAEVELRIRRPADQPVNRVRAFFGGELPFRREGDWVITQVALPSEVNVVIVE